MQASRWPSPWRTLGVLGAILVLGLSAVDASEIDAEQRTLHRDLPARAGGEVVVVLLAGSVEITGHDDRRIVLDAELGTGVEALEVLEDGQRVLVETRVDDAQRSGEAASVTLRMTVPRASRVRIQTVDADLGTEGLTGTLELETVAGEIRVGGEESRQILVTTATGEVHLEAPSLRGRVRSASGPVRVAAEIRDLGVVTATAGITVESSVVQEMDLQTVAGGVEVDGEVTSTGRLRVRTHTGDVRLRVPSTTEARLRLESKRGRVTNALGGGVDGVVAQGSGVDLVLGRGGPSIDVETLEGDIAVEIR